MIALPFFSYIENKGNNKITELQAILQRESQNSYVYKQTKSVNNRKTENRDDPDLVQAFLKKWWVESDFKASSGFLLYRTYIYSCLHVLIRNDEACYIDAAFFAIKVLDFVIDYQ